MLEPTKKKYRRLSPPHWGQTTHQKFLYRLRLGVWKDHARSRVLEKSIARRLNIPASWVLATSSCTSALGVAYRFICDGLFSDDRPFRVCPLTYPGTYCWAINNGYNIEWVDCDYEGWPVGEVDVGVDLWGRRFPNKCVILDAAHRVLDPHHAVGLREGTYKAVCYSFGPSKECPSLEGGALLAPFLEDPKARAFAESWIESGQRLPLFGGIKGYLSAPIADSIGSQICIHKRMHYRRQKVLEVYQKWFGPDLLTPPGEASGHLCVIRLKSYGHKLAACRRLERLGIEHNTHYPIAEELPCPNAKALTQEILSLPMHPYMSPNDVIIIARNVLSAV